MTSASANLTYDIQTQYVGDLALVGKGKTPFLNLITGGGGNNWMNRFAQSMDVEFPLAVEYGMDAAAQPAITENQSIAGQTPKVYSTAQATNCVQIFQRGINASYLSQSAKNKLTSGGLMVAGEKFTPNGLALQKAANLRNLALDLDKTLVAGSYQSGTNADTAWKTRGITSAISTNAVNAGGDALATADIDTAMIALAETVEAPMDDMYIMGGAAAVKKVSDLYGIAPFAGPDNTTGGNKIETIITQFGRLKLMWEPNVAAATLIIFDLSQIALVGLPVEGKGVLFYEDLEPAGASTKGQFYGQLGLGYRHEKFHAKITNFI